MNYFHLQKTVQTNKYAIASNKINNNNNNHSKIQIHFFQLNFTYYKEKVMKNIKN